MISSILTYSLVNDAHSIMCYLVTKKALMNKSGDSQPCNRKEEKNSVCKHKLFVTPDTATSAAVCVSGKARVSDRVQ